MADTPENDLLDESNVKERTETESNPLHELQMAIAALPAVDAKRVEEVLQKLREGRIDILGNDADKLASSNRIARLIIDESSGTD